MQILQKLDSRRVSAAAVSLTLLVLLLFNADAYADKVTDWNRIATMAQTNLNRTNNATIGTDLAYMHIAIYDAVNAIDGRYTVFAVRPASVPAGASQEAAAVEAAYRVLRAILPTSQAA